MDNAAAAANRAAEEMRQFNHLTLDPAAEPETLEHAANIYDALGALLYLSRRLPQGLQQLGRHLEREQHKGRLGTDATTDQDAAHHVEQVITSLKEAEEAAAALAAALNKAHAASRVLTDRESEAPQLAAPEKTEPYWARDRAMAVAYVRGNFIPPLPEAYADWLMEMREMVANGADGTELLEVPAAISEDGPVPRGAQYDAEAAVHRITLREALAALRQDDLLSDA